jgi:hypothetical protein
MKTSRQLNEKKINNGMKLATIGMCHYYNIVQGIDDLNLFSKSRNGHG